MAWKGFKSILIDDEEEGRSGKNALGMATVGSAHVCVVRRKEENERIN